LTAKAPIVVIKKKRGHSGHHGGAWKVAYADFVTAMMALFIVLWLLNTSKQIQEAVGGYFKDPSGSSRKVGSSLAGSGNNFTVTKDNMAQIKEQLQKAIRELPNFDMLKNHIDMTVTNEGLRIELTESEGGTFFDSGSAKLNPSNADLLAKLAEELGKLPNKIAIEGHTDAKPYSRGGDFGNWELSADRANAARRFMTQNGLRQDQITQVRGFADRVLRKPAAPLDPSNRRISLIVQYLAKDEDKESAAAGKETGNETPQGARSSDTPRNDGKAPKER